MIDLTNPTNLPDPAEIEYMEEPMVKAEIMVTSESISRSDPWICVRNVAEYIREWNISKRNEQY